MACRVVLLLFSPFILLLLLLLAASCTAQEGTKFQCSGTAKCEALAGYVPVNDTTYDAIKSLFQVKSIRALFAANNVSASTPASARVPAGTAVKVPFPCACANGTGVSEERPVYTVVSGDILYNIATEIFQGFVVYQQIAAANRLKNASDIDVGQELWIPLPCSCDPVGGVEAVHLVHVVAKGSNLTAIAGQFGSTEETLRQINNISDPKDLQQGQILDVPIRACNSSIPSGSHDSARRVPDGSYALTASGCVKCSCSYSSSSRLQCEIVQDMKNTTKSNCRAEMCSVGNSTVAFGQSVPNVCGSTRCEYAGHNSSDIFTTAVDDQSACGAPGTERPGSGARALRPQPWGPSRWAQQQLLLAPLSTALLLFTFL